MIVSSLDWYARLVRSDLVQESGGPARKVPEIEIQARWYSGEFGTRWVTTDGVTLRVVDFGEWNREPGPDFTGATLQLADGSILRGDIEIDTDVRDWERHGHVENVAFGKTVLHVFLRQPDARFFTRSHDNRLVHQVLLDLSQVGMKSAKLPDGLPLCGSPDDASKLLTAAARYRLHRKSQALQRAAEGCGEDAAWYRALAVALGYKSNKLPFLLLAERCGPVMAAKPDGEAMLFGMAGFLTGTEPALTPAPTRAYLKSLWDQWWVVRAANDRLVISHGMWRMGGVRPANHPHRRVAALHALAKHWASVAAALRAGDRAAFVHALERCTHPFWSFHFNLSASPLRSAQALIGAQRVQEMTANVFYPAAMSRHESLWEQYKIEPGSTVTRSYEMLADRFFPGAGLDRKFLNSGIHQQGLLQLEADFLSAKDPIEFVDGIRSQFKFLI